MKIEIEFTYIPEKCSECIFCNWTNEGIIHNIAGDNIKIITDEDIVSKFGVETIGFCSKYKHAINSHVLMTTELDRHPRYKKTILEYGYEGGKCGISYKAKQSSK